MSLPGNSAGSAPPRTLGTKPLKFNGTSNFRGERRRALFRPTKIARFANTPQTAVQHDQMRGGGGYLQGTVPAGDGTKDRANSREDGRPRPSALAPFDHKPAGPSLVPAPAP